MRWLVWWSGEGDVTWGMLRKVGGLQLNRDVRTALMCCVLRVCDHLQLHHNLEPPV